MKEGCGIEGKTGESIRCFSEARHPLREKGRRIFLDHRFGVELRELIPEPLRIAVFGSGDGKEAAALENHFPDAFVVCLDISGPELAQAAARLRKGFPLVRGDWDHPPFNDAGFDLIVFFASLHHAEDLGRTLSEIHRLLSPGGWIYATHEPMASWLLGRIQRRHMAHTASLEGGIESSPSYHQYLRAMREAGFESISIRPASLNLIRLTEISGEGFEDVRMRRSDLPERLVRALVRVSRGLGEPFLFNLIFFLQRLALGLYGVTIRGRRKD